MTDETIRDSQSRQGPKGKPVLYVLIGSMVLLAGFFVVYMTWVGSSPPDSARANAPGATTASGLTTPTGGGNPTDRTMPANPAYPAPTDGATGALSGAR